MHHFSSDGIDIAYIDEGEGDPILLIHGFASNMTVNWIDTGWVRTLKRAGCRVIAYDNRGHGMSEKLYDEKYYGAPLMAEDARRLLEHLDIPRADIMGYSMGARITAFLLMNHPHMVRSAIFGGYGINMARAIAGRHPIAKALEQGSIDDVVNRTARTFRQFAESTGSDLKALAYCYRAASEVIAIEDFKTIETPILVAVGSEDVIGGSATQLAEIIPGAEALEIEGRDHMKAVGDPVYKAGVLDFLKRRP